MPDHAGNRTYYPFGMLVHDYVYDYVDMEGTRLSFEVLHILEPT